MKKLILFVLLLALAGCADRKPESDAAETQSAQFTEAEETVVYAENPTVSAVFFHEYDGECEEFAVSESPYAEKVVFRTDSTVRNFCLLTLELEEFTDDGRISFASEEIYRLEELIPEKGLAVTMNLPETIPYYGISYMDGAGRTRMFSVNLSGFDGSVYLSEIGGE